MRISCAKYAAWLHLPFRTTNMQRGAFFSTLDREGIRLKKIKATHIESYIAKAGERLSRATLQHEISVVRGFLRFLALDGRAPDGLGSQIDTPRLYRLEKLPRSLPWETVQAFLRSIDRTSATGLRDYAIFLLIATYGLRSQRSSSHYTRRPSLGTGPSTNPSAQDFVALRTATDQ